MLRFIGHAALATAISTLIWGVILSFLVGVLYRNAVNSVI